jgi:hypothetical protein
MIYVRETEASRKLRVEVVEADDVASAYEVGEATTIGSLSQRRGRRAARIAIRGPFKSAAEAIADGRRRGMRRKR